MAYPTFKPPVNPDSALDRQHTPAIRTSQFGDGYEQTTITGINSDMEIINPKWTNARKAEADYILDFLGERKGRPFYYQPYGQGAIRCYRCETYNDRQKRGNYYDITATFKQTAMV